MSDSTKAEGIIIKSIDGFFFVETGEGTYPCRARGVFRKQKMKPVAGDYVSVLLSETEGNVVDCVHERKSMLLRPPVANIDRLFIISSVKEPNPNFLVIDRMVAIAVNRGIDPVVVFSKSDLGDTAEYVDIYRKAGLVSFAVSCKTGEGVEQLRQSLNGHISAFSGNSGVGKSSLLNVMFPDLNLETGDISQKLGRGRHTTRESRLYPVEGGYVADTPGFSSLEFEGEDVMVKENVAFGFPEFVPYLGTCKFSTCRHMNDKGCKILEAVNRGEIAESRHQSYVTLMNEALALNEWEIKK